MGYGQFSTRSTKGSVLLAVPLLDEPTFHRTVVYMMQHDEDGALGVVLNRPTDEDSLPGLDSWMLELSHPQVVFEGGPVESSTLIAVAALAHDAESDAYALLADGLGTVDLAKLPSDVAEGLRNLRVFRGYAGWGPGQLDDELEEGSWLVLDCDINDVFSRNPRDLWRNLLRRHGGHKALLADAPDDLHWN
ncbi:MAG TPA: YqgE/AlgH family protein [Ilumatobacteraceae bacterium]